MKSPKLSVLALITVLSLYLPTTGCSPAAKSGADDSAVPPEAPSAAEPETPAEPSDAADSSTESDENQLGLRSFSASTLDGGVFTQDDLAEKDLTIINFWSTSCGPCIREMPELASFEKALPDNVQLLTACLDAPGNEESVAELLNEAGFEGLTLTSGDGDFLTVCYNLMYTPTTLLADSEGNLVGVLIGGQENLEEAYLEAANSALKAAGKDEISLTAS